MQHFRNPKHLHLPHCFTWSIPVPTLLSKKVTLSSKGDRGVHGLSVQNHPWRTTLLSEVLITDSHYPRQNAYFWALLLHIDRCTLTDPDGCHLTASLSSPSLYPCWMFSSFLLFHFTDSMNFVRAFLDSLKHSINKCNTALVLWS